MSIILAPCVYADCPVPSIKESAVLDIGSTAIAISQGANELNPLGLVGSTIAKGIIIANEKDLSPSEKVNASAIWTGASVNNLMVIMGATFFPAILTGIAVGIVIKTNNNCTKEPVNG